jgi:Zn-dependent protease with chaperone function
MRLLRVATTTAILIVPLIAVHAAAQTASRTEKVDGYAEYRRGEWIVVDGQRLVLPPSVPIRARGGPFASLRDVPLGHEVQAQGRRDATGALVVTSIVVRPNGDALFERDIRQATDQMEAMWLERGEIVEDDGSGSGQRIGRIVDSGPRVDRAERIMRRLLPPYLGPEAVRVRVVESKEWNAMAMGNGALWVFSGLLDDMDDDEVAIVLGHELAHYTHEHSRRGFRRAMWTQLVAIGVAVAAEAAIESERTRAIVGLASAFSLLAWQNGYGRDHEDQADRVGLRYAHEGGFDVSKGPALWEKFAKKYGQPNAVANFFFGNHSQASARSRHLRREIDLNYRPH